MVILLHYHYYHYYFLSLHILVYKLSAIVR